MYDEAIEVYDEDDDDGFDYSNSRRIGGGGGELSPVRKPKHSSLNKNIGGSSSGFNMEPLEEIRPKTLSSKDFVTPRPGTSQRQAIDSPVNRIQNIPQEAGRMSDAHKRSSGDETAVTRKASSKGPRPMSAQRRGPPSDEDDEDDEEDFDEELNVAQIEGMLAKRYIDRRGDYADGMSSESSYSSEEDIDNQIPPTPGQSLFLDFDPPPPPLPHFDEDDGIIFDNCFDIPPPAIAYHVPPFLDDETLIKLNQAMDEFIRHRKLWELQLDMKRQTIGDQVRERHVYRGIHDLDLPIYNPDDYANLTVSPEIKEIFGYITQYVPPGLNSQQDVKLCPFIPDYYPSVGDIDAFIKVVDPGVKDDGLGIKCLDEPAPFQSDPSVLDLRLRALAKQSSAKAVVIKKVENVGKNSKIIENWIKDISDLHRSKPSPSVHYSKPMPDIDFLMQEWPPEMEDLLKSVNLPSPDLNCDLATYVDIICNLVDIPVYKSRVQSLHVLFTLYTTQKQFSQLGGGASGLQGHEADLMPSNTSLRLSDNENVDHLQIS